MKNKLGKIISILLCVCLIFEQSAFAQVAAQLDVVGYLNALRSSFLQDKFRPLHLRYISYDILNNNFKLLLDKGDLKNPQTTELENVSKDLLKYFFIGISLPNDSFWVNLRPDAEENIIDGYLAQTEVGKIMLEADLQLKKSTAKASSPETPEGKEYWDKLYKKAGEIFGYDNVTIPTLTRPWIVPDEIIIRESADSAYVYKATLKVMLEQDYLKNSSVYNFEDERLRQLNEYSSQLIRELIIPKLTKEINNSKRYAPLRQVYYSLILAQWFKARYANKDTIYSHLINRRDLANLVSKESWSKTTYFKQYQKSFKEGEYNISEPVYSPYGQTVRSYFSGGMSDFMNHPQVVQELTRPIGDADNKAILPAAIPAIASQVLNKYLLPGVYNADGQVHILTQAAAPPVGKQAGGSRKDEGSSPIQLLSRIQASQIDNIFEKSLKQPLKNLEQIEEASSLSEAVRILRAAEIPIGTMRKIRVQNKEEFLIQLKVITNELNLEISLWRIRGTNDWIMIKGGDTAPRTIEIDGEEAPFYLFDNDIHNHPREPDFAIPSPPDFWVFYDKHVGAASQFIITSGKGMTLVNIRGLVESLTYDEVKDLLFRIIIERVQRQVREKHEIEIEGLDPMNPLVRPFYIEELNMLRREGKIKLTFIPWREAKVDILRPTKFQLSEQLQSPFLSDRTKAHDILANFYDGLDADFLFSLFGAFIQDPNEKIQVDILDHKVTFHFGYGEERDRVISFFLDSPHPIIRALASLQLSTAEGVNQRVEGKFEEFLENSRKLKTLSRSLNFRIHTMIGFHLNQGLIFANELTRGELEQIGEEILGIYLARLNEAGMNRGGLSDPLVEAAQVLRERWELKSTNSPLSSEQISQEVNAPGGIDFRMLPIVTHAISNLSLDTSYIPLSRVDNINLNQEWQEIRKMVEAGITPSTERIKKHIRLSCLKDEFNDVQKIISCIADILRDEEGRCSSTEPMLKDILIVLQSGKSTQELKAVFMGSQP